MIKYCTTLLLLLSLTSILSAQIISEDKDANNYYGIFGETTESLLSQQSYYVNIGKDFIQATLTNTSSPITAPKLKLNPNGSPVEVGGEVNRSSTTTADLLPYAYGDISNDANLDRGTSNYTTTFGTDGAGLNYADITFSDPNINTLDLIIVATPRSFVPMVPNIINKEEVNKNKEKSSSTAIGINDPTQVFIDHLDTNGSNTCRVYLFTRTGGTASQYFSFIAYNL